MLRRDGKLFRRGLIPALVLSLLLAGACALAGFSVFRGSVESRAPIQVAIVDGEGGVLSRLAINLVSGQSYIASLMEITQVNERRARAGLADGTYAAVILLPEGYIDDIRYGRAGSGEILLSDAAELSSGVICHVARFGELLLAAGQYGVFAGENVARQEGISDAAYADFLDRSNDILMDIAFSLYEDGVTAREAAYLDTGVSAAAYYGTVWFTLLLLISGLFFGALYTQDTGKSTMTRLLSLGITPLSFSLGKLLYPLLYRAFLLLLFCLGFSFLAETPLFLSAGSLLIVLLGLMLATGFISFSALLIGGKKGYEGLLTGICALGLFLTGGLVPRQLLPASVGFLGRFSPSGAVASCLVPLFGGRIDVLSVVFLLVLDCLLAFLALRRLALLPLKGGDA